MIKYLLERFQKVLNILKERKVVKIYYQINKINIKLNSILIKIIEF